MTERLIEQILKANQVSLARQQQIFNPWELEEVPLFYALQHVSKRIKQAISNQERIVIVGDYDADGICSTAILVDTFQRLNYPVTYYIPNRLTDGYGLSTALVERIAEKGYELIITVDNGVTAQAAISTAESLGLSVIVTDHHSFQTFPSEFLLHPSQFPPRYQGLAGAGVVLQLARVLLKPAIIPAHFILAMVATIGDVMEVFEENRVIIQTGLKFFNTIGYPALEQLLTSKMPITEEDVAFQIVPRLNTIGRLADYAEAYHLVDYLLTSDLTKVKLMAKKIERLNDLRKQLTETGLEIAQHITAYGAFYVISDPNIHEGVAGIIAGKLVEQYRAPVLVLAQNAQGYKGSGRSLAGFNLYEFLLPHQDLFTAFGGHALACGFSLLPDKYPLLLKVLAETTPMVINQTELIAPYELASSEISVHLVQSLASLRPFGPGLLAPTFAINRFSYDEVVLIKNEHLKLINHAEQIEALYFYGQKAYSASLAHRVAQLVGNLALNEFKGQRKVNIIIRSIDFFK